MKDRNDHALDAYNYSFLNELAHTWVRSTMTYKRFKKEYEQRPEPEHKGMINITPEIKQLTEGTHGKEIHNQP